MFSKILAALFFGLAGFKTACYINYFNEPMAAMGIIIILLGIIAYKLPNSNNRMGG